MNTLKNSHILIVLLVVVLLLPTILLWSFLRAVSAEKTAGETAFRELTMIAETLESENKHDEAITMAKRHQEILQRVFTRHKYIALTDAFMGRVYARQHKYLLALNMFRQAEKMMEDLRLQKSPEMVRIYLDIIAFHVSQKQYAAALQYAQKAEVLMKRYPEYRDTLPELTRGMQEWRK